MAENKMKEVAKLLGVEMGVPFNIKGSKNNPHMITEHGLLNHEGNMFPCELSKLLRGVREIEQSILDKAEKRYLENVLRPFKDKVEFIRKVCEYSKSQDYIHIGIKNDFDIDFPNFQQGTMYKGMELNKEYTIEELGLFEEEE
jgi:hypothetical protein|nr:MAG TPA: hypothetical protein [Caudoviricetes sp.]